MTNEEIVLKIKSGVNTEENTLLLWQKNKGYIYKIANSYKEYGELEDLEQEGYIGLCSAVQHYDPVQGVQFISYATFWIKQRMSRYIRNNNVIRIPEHAIDRLMRYKRMARYWKMKLDRWPTDREVMDFLNLSREQLKDLKSDLSVNKVSSLDIPAGEDEDIDLYELLPGGGFEDDLIDELQHEQLKKTIWSLVDGLPGQQPEVIRERYQKGKTLEEVGQLLGVNRDRARTIESNGLRELRKPSRANQLRPFLYDEIYSRGLKGNGLERFRTTWTSSTERTALKMIE